MKEYLNYLYGDAPDADSPRIEEWNAKCEEALVKLEEWKAMGIDMDAVQAYYYYQQNVEELKQAEAYAEKDPVGATFLSFADKFIGNISSEIYEATHYISGEALNYNSTYYMPGKKADITRNKVANNLAEDIGGMGGEFARQSFWIGVATGDIVVELAVDAAVGAGVGATVKTVGTAAKATGSAVAGTVHVLNGVDNVGDACRLADGLDDSFDTIKSFSRVEDSLDIAKTFGG